MTEIVKRDQKCNVSLLFCIALNVWADTMPVSLDRNAICVTYETLTLPSEEAMGLVGLNYQQMFGSYWYSGLGVYGAAAGERGGFFTGGFEGGFHYPLLSDFEAEMGIFIGGGGGGAAPQGGGLMIRPHIGLTYGNADIRAGVQLSRIEFPNGEIKSSQIAAVVDVPFESFRLDGSYRGRLDRFSYDVSEILQRSMKPARGAFGVEVQRYQPSKGSHKTDGSSMDDAFNTVGVRYEHSFNPTVVGYLTTAGAIGGGTDGYAEIFSGIGWRYPLSAGTPALARLNVCVEGAVGLGGGGRIDTGGGTMGKGATGLSYRINPDWIAEFKGGYTRAFDGEFSGQTVSFSIAHPLNTLRPTRDNLHKKRYDFGLMRKDWQIRPLHETYISAQRKNQTDADISLVGMQIDILTGGLGYFYGKALGAYSGDAGGYATGTLGMGINYKFSLFNLYTQAGVGAGGGGGVDVGSAAIVESEAGVGIDVASNTNLWLGVGVTKSLAGELLAPTLQFGVAYHFATLG